MARHKYSPVAAPLKLAILLLAANACDASPSDPVPVGNEALSERTGLGVQGVASANQVWAATGTPITGALVLAETCCYTDECDPFPEGPDLLEEECPDPHPGSPGYWIPSWDPVSCFGEPTWDPDNDGMNNACENALAAAFAPEMRFSGDCNWDYALDRMGGEYYYAVEEVAANTARIAYLPAYYVDCGPARDDWDWCFWNPSECAPHSGDSEFLLIDVTYDANQHWSVDSVLPSAHCDPEQYPSRFVIISCRWRSRSALEWNDVVYGAPSIWVSYGKHANYPTLSECQSGGVLGHDYCDPIGTIRDFPVLYTQQNVGSRLTPLRDCATAFSGSPLVNPNAIECMWFVVMNGRFNGWQGQVFGDRTTQYGQLLAAYAGF